MSIDKAQQLGAKVIKKQEISEDIRRTKNNFREWQNKYINNKLSAIIFSFFNIILCH
jgi:hypothetical protein